ncbi:MAG: phenylalanine--tRNA ligase subunit beta [Candidatus Izemoplasmataceae bacterium]
MKLSINWLKELYPFDVDTNKIETLFNTLSQEVEYLKPLVSAKKLIIGYTVSCKAHPDADKLSVCMVDVGDKTLQIICGAPNVREGQHVIVALDGAVLPGDFQIKKTVIRGVESNGMICSLSELGIEQKYHGESGIHVIKEPIEVGSDALKALALDDFVLSLDLTPNRSDLLSMQGVAYDLAAMLDKPYKVKDVVVNETKESNPLKITINTDACISYYGRVIKNITIKESPNWMKARLIAAGIRPINNVVDITNYVMLETGQPLHAFDYDLLDSQEIIVRMAKDDETFKTLDDKVRTLKKDDIAITNGKEIVALGGVMGGALTEVHAKTSSIMLESAVFSPVHIRKTSSRLDLRSESSMRFERKVNPENTRYALDLATHYLELYADASPLKGVEYVDHHDKTPVYIKVTLDKINRVLGSQLTSDDVSKTLDRLAFSYTLKDESFTIKKPARRVDFENYQDIIEEIGRLHGYDSLPLTLPKTVSVGRLTPYQSLKRAINQTLTGLGLNEVITYALRDEGTIHDYTLNKKLKAVKLDYPMSEHRNTLSLSPLNGLVEVLAYNNNRKLKDGAIFEIGKSYQVDEELERLGIAMMGTYKDGGFKEGIQTDFYTIKSVLNAMFEALKIQNITYKATTIDNYHPHQTALIIKDEHIIGHIGKLHPSHALMLDLENVFLAEIDVKALLNDYESQTTFTALSKYPSVSRDLAIVCDKSITANLIKKAILNANINALKSIKIFDIYEGDHVKETEKSVALRLTFEADKTLETKEVDGFIQSILSELKESLHATLR